MDNFFNEVMEIIIVIKSYIDKYGHADIIDNYYKTNGTYIGIVEYLNDIENKNNIWYQTLIVWITILRISYFIRDLLWDS